MNVKIPINNTVGFIIGDIFVNVDIQFRPMRVPYEILETISIDEFNHRLGGLAFEIKQKVQEVIENNLKEGEK